MSANWMLLWTFTVFLSLMINDECDGHKRPLYRNASDKRGWWCAFVTKLVNKSIVFCVSSSFKNLVVYTSKWRCYFKCAINSTTPFGDTQQGAYIWTKNGLVYNTCIILTKTYFCSSTYIYRESEVKKAWTKWKKNIQY